MFITFSPMRSDDALSVSIDGDMLKINGDLYDFTAIPEGAVLPSTAVDCAWLASDVTRLNGDIHLSLILPHGAHAAKEALFPTPVHVTTKGPLVLPTHEKEVTQ